MKSLMFRGSLRAHVQRVFLVAFALAAITSLSVVWKMASRARDRDEAARYVALSQLLADLARHPLEISDYSDAQRMLSFVSQDPGIVPAVLTEEGDLLLGDYSRSLDVGSQRSARSCADVQAAARPASQRVFCREIVGVRGGVGAVGDRLGLSLVFVNRRQVVPLRELSWFFGAMIVILLVLSWIIRRYFTLFVVEPLESLRAWARERKERPLAPSSAAPTSIVAELEDLRAAFTELLEAVSRESLKREESERELALGELARQVAHDIRSPLAALETAAADISHIPEEKRLLIRSATSRIRDIANSLLERHRERLQELSSPGPGLLSGLIEPVITEKRMQFRSRPEVVIDVSWDSRSYGLFGRVQSVEFQRLLSNLINNAVEALEGRSGAVQVALGAKADFAMITVRDNGKGISADVLTQLGERGRSFGKAEGSGLGLYHARRSAESWGGRLEISSELGKGTVVSVFIPLAPAPAWFAPELTLTSGQAVVVLDDDVSVHQLWDERIKGHKNARFVHLYGPEKLTAWTKRYPEQARTALFLLDYELIGHECTGLDLAESLRLGSRAVLVTSWYEEPAIVQRCLRNGMRIIPKGLARLVPIRERPVVAVDAVLIDDDALTHAAWSMAAERAGKTIRTFSTIADFLAVSHEIDRSTPIYIDVRLKGGVDGAQESRRLFDDGFRKLYLATGHEPDQFAGLAHICGVVGKEPPEL